MMNRVNTYLLIVITCISTFSADSLKSSKSHIKANLRLSNPIDIEIQDSSSIFILSLFEPRLLSNCSISISNCELCTFENCTKCKKTFTLVNNTCSLIRISNEITPGGLTILIIVVSLFGFLSLFCFICIYFARKNRHKYAESPNIQGEHTKQNSIASEVNENPTQSTVIISDNQGFNRAVNNGLDHFRESFQNDHLKASDVCLICFGNIRRNDIKYLENGNSIHNECSEMEMSFKTDWETMK